MTTKYTSLEKIMLVNANPVKNISNFIGLGFAIYYLWIHEPINALIWGLGIALSGTVVAIIFYNRSAGQLADTWLGRLYLSYSNGVGFSLYLASHVLIPYGFWLNNLLVVGIGLLCLIIGWLLGNIVLKNK